jgi:hypothetical protein
MGGIGDENAYYEDYDAIIVCATSSSKICKAAAADRAVKYRAEVDDSGIFTSPPKLPRWTAKVTGPTT